MRKIGIILLFLLTLSCQNPAFALEEAGVILPDQKLYPKSFYYSVKRLVEKGQEKLRFSNESKYDFQKSLLPTRLAELVYVVKEEQVDQVQKSSERFSYQAGVTTQQLKGLQDKENEKKALQEKFSEYIKVLESLRNTYTFNSSYWMLIEHSINSLKIYSEELQK